jgi:hypothetical protein
MVVIDCIVAPFHIFILEVVVLLLRLEVLCLVDSHR